MAVNAAPGPTVAQMQAAQNMSAEDRRVMIENMVAGLAARLEETPDDVEGWVMLGRSYSVLGRKDESVAAFTRAAELAPDDLSVRLAQAEALLSALGADNEQINEEAVAALREVERLQPNHPLALYFLGVHARQQGDAEKARAYWTRLKALLPAESPDAIAMDEMIGQL